MDIKKIFYMLLVCFLVLSFLASVSAGRDDPEARKIMEKVDERDDGDNLTFDMEMILIDKNQNQRLRRIVNFQKDKGKDTYKLMFFKYPADVKDTGFLTFDYDDWNKDDDQWLYLPALRKTKRIASTDRSGSFMGSDFNYSDMTSRNLEDYDYAIIKEMAVRGNPVWVIQAVPRTDEIIEETGYFKSIGFVRKDNYFIVRAIHFVNGKKQLKYMDVKQLKKIDDIWVGTLIEMTTRQGKRMVHKTILKKDNIKFNQNLDESIFSIRRLEKGI